MTSNTARIFSFLLKCLLVLLIVALVVEYLHYILAAAVVGFLIYALSNSGNGGQRLHEFPSEPGGSNRNGNNIPHSSKYK